MSSRIISQAITKASDIYAEGLFHLGHGYPLCGPEPDETCGEVRLGDVGYIRDVNSKQGVPDNFEIFSPPPNSTIQRPNEITATMLHSQSARVNDVSMGLNAGQAGVAGAAKIHFMSEKNRGALLLLKRPGHKTYLNCDLYIKGYMKRNLDSWEAFARDQRRIGLKDKDILFVHGFTKTTVWAEAAFRSGGSDVGLVLSGGVLSVSGDITIARKRHLESSPECRCGPPERVADWDTVSSTDEPFNQCIFLNFYKMKRRRFCFWPTTSLRDGVLCAESSNDDDGWPSYPRSDDDDIDQNLVSTTVVAGDNSDDSDSQFNTIEEVPQTAFDPVDQILDRILEDPDVDVAWASDEDLRYVFQDNCLLDDVSTHVDDDNIGTIGPPTYDEDRLGESDEEDYVPSD